MSSLTHSFGDTKLNEFTQKAGHREWDFLSHLSFRLFDVQVPAVVPKDVVECSCHTIARYVRQFSIARSWSSGEFSPQRFGGQQPIDGNRSLAVIHQHGSIGVADPFDRFGRRRQCWRHPWWMVSRYYKGIISCVERWIRFHRVRCVGRLFCLISLSLIQNFFGGKFYVAPKRSKTCSRPIRTDTSW